MDHFVKTIIHFLVRKRGIQSGFCMEVFPNLVAKSTLMFLSGQHKRDARFNCHSSSKHFHNVLICCFGSNGVVQMARSAVQLLNTWRKNDILGNLYLTFCMYETRGLVIVPLRVPLTDFKVNKMNKMHQQKPRFIE